MATDDLNKEKKSLQAHDEPARIEAHKEAQRLGAHAADTTEELKKELDEVPAVTADVDENPRFVKYGAAVLLGLAFGVGCYVWYSVPQDEAIGQAKFAKAATEAYFNQNGAYDNPAIQGTVPDPFSSPFEPTLDGGYTENPTYGIIDLSEAGTDVVAPGQAAVTSFTTPEGTDVDAAVVNPGDGSVVYLFEYASADVPETKELTSIAKHATANGLCLDVRAYTDENGRPAYNKRLSEKRAKAIGDYLIAHGVPARNVSVHGMGPTHKFGSDAQDRRAEVIEIRK